MKIAILFDGASALAKSPDLLILGTVEAIERAVPEARGTIAVEGPPLPFPEELDASAFVEVVGEVPLTPFDEGVAATIAHFRRA